MRQEKQTAGPLRFWYGMLDQGGINAAILYNFNIQNPILNRRDFLKILIHELIEPFLRVRYTIPTLRRDLRIAIETILEIPTTNQPKVTAPSNRKQARCFICPRVMDRKVKTYCEKCNRPCCDEHRLIFCNNCSETQWAFLFHVKLNLYIIKY